ncbi:hypothetical protein FE257_012978 [Aspergillus nanangensis]|uniref:Zn(2)-C6 fungal-type domain-containing protein n=1 Tax=Aspergillus nanangensis TaxID=2582783 RepID=A0AAD4CF48_ASPNN|nr:hypothetical protein FE257_012978 [Aspergillus nanangensis]
MAASHPRRQLQCDQCARQYSSVSHLKRHQTTHVPKKPAICIFCNRQFLRSDVLLRHSRNCKEKGARTLPRVKRGRKPKACDSCAISRVACDGDSPCDVCLFKSIQCTYGSSQQQQTRGQEGSDTENPAGDPTYKPPLAETSNSQRIPISFLLNITDPSIQFPYDIHRVISQHNEGISGPIDQTHSDYWTDSDPFMEAWSSIFNTVINISAVDTSPEGSDQVYGLNDPANLPGTVDRLISCLEQAPAYNSNPFIHKASFNVNTASPALLLGIILLGSTYVSPEDASAAVEYHTLAEYIVFEGPEFRQLLYEDKNPGLSAANIQLIQAALLVIGLQGSRSQLEANRRMRVQRVPALVSVARLLNLTRVVNDAIVDVQLLNVERYVHEETLVRIMAWIYLLDCNCVIFYHFPPQFKIFEANFGLPRQSSIFDAVTPAEENEPPSDGISTHLPLTLRSIVQQLMADKPSQLEVLQTQVDSLFALFLVLSALHCVLFDLQALGDFTDISTALVPVERALDRWKIIWDAFCTRQKQSGVNMSGFMVHALEFWWLAKMLVKKPVTFGPNGRVATDSIQSFHDMIKDLRAAI